MPLLYRGWKSITTILDVKDSRTAIIKIKYLELKHNVKLLTYDNENKPVLNGVILLQILS